MSGIPEDTSKPKIERREQPPRRPPDISLPVNQPIPPGPGIEYWIKRILGVK